MAAAATEDSKETEIEKSERTIARWYIHETLGKGGYSWVKRGVDKMTGTIVALKFMSLADSSWREDQMDLVKTEIECLKRVRHRHVLKLYAYNMGAKYPRGKKEDESDDDIAEDAAAASSKKEFIDAIMLVLEFAPGGDLFDILYYTSRLEPIIARTYFRQLMSGLNACHTVGICHRDLKPQNLLLDSKFNLKITDFGLSKVAFTPSTDASVDLAEDAAKKAKKTVMTTAVGTRGYKAPELLLGLPFGFSCDIFSSGVILFILLNGYPPFENALKTDHWYRPAAKGDYAKFWEAHSECAIFKDEAVKQLLWSMLAYNPDKRANMEAVRSHEWTNGKRLKSKDLVTVLRMRHSKMEVARRADSRKMTDLQTSVGPSRAIGVDRTAVPPLYPEDEVESVLDLYTQNDWIMTISVIKDVIAAAGGEVRFSKEKFALQCLMSMISKAPPTTTGTVDASDFSSSQVSFVIQVFRSRLYSKPPPEAEDEDTEPVYAIRIRRVSGYVTDYRKVLESVIFTKCAGVLTGLPDWATREGAIPMEPGSEDDEEVDSDIEASEEADEYDRSLAASA